MLRVCLPNFSFLCCLTKFHHWKIDISMANENNPKQNKRNHKWAKHQQHRKNLEINVLQFVRKKCVNHKWTWGYQSRLSSLCITFGTVHTVLTHMLNDWTDWTVKFSISLFTQIHTDHLNERTKLLQIRICEFVSFRVRNFWKCSSFSLVPEMHE